MAYSELIKSFERIRDYVREFYVYGFRTRGQYDQKSARSYDNERRRLESWLGGWIGSRRTAEGKNMFISIDSRAAGSSPLFRIFKSKSFTDGDITLHFILFDILFSEEIALPLSEITERVDGYLSEFREPMSFDSSTIRKKLSEYVSLGLIRTEKSGRQTLYRRAASADISGWRDAPEFFSEAGMCGVVGSFILDKLGGSSENFTFKHHYMTHVLESEVLCSLLEAISERRCVRFSYFKRRDGSRWAEQVCVPLKIFVSVQTGRRWLAGYSLTSGDMTSFRLDYIRDVAAGEQSPQFSALRQRLSLMQENIWGIAFSNGSTPKRVSFTLNTRGDGFILKKLLREKRCGKVEQAGENTYRFTAYVYDTGELIPWIRSFTGYIESLDFADKEMEKRLRQDTEEMYRIYGIE